MSNARSAWHPQREIEIVAGTPPGGGLDRSARALMKVIESQQLLDVPVKVTNVAGDVVEVRTRGVSAKAIGAPESSEAILAERQGGKLTERESQLLMLLAAGRTNREIAAHLNIAESTARVHVARLMDKVRDGLRERERPGPHRPSRSRSWEEIGESVSTAQEEQEPGAATDK